MNSVLALFANAGFQEFHVIVFIFISSHFLHRFGFVGMLEIEDVLVGFLAERFIGHSIARAQPDGCHQNQPESDPESFLAVVFPSPKHKQAIPLPSIRIVILNQGPLGSQEVKDITKVVTDAV